MEASGTNQPRPLYGNNLQTEGTSPKVTVNSPSPFLLSLSPLFFGGGEGGAEEGNCNLENSGGKTFSIQESYKTLVFFF